MSTLPTGQGERVVLRLLDQDAARLDLTALGMSDATLPLRSPDPRAARHPARHRPDRLRQDDDALCGAVAAQRGSVNIMTVEDPIEYALDGVDADARSTRASGSLSRARCARSCARTPTS